MTGVFAGNVQEFKLWAKERRLIPVNLATNTFKDSEGEEYTPITKIDDIRGRRFADYEIPDYCSLSAFSKYNMEEEIRKRIYK